MDEQIDWGSLFDFDDAFFDSASSTLPTSSPDAPPLSADDIEQFLLKDDDGVPNAGGDAFQETADAFFDDIFLDSPLDCEKSGEVVDSAPAEDHKNEDAVVDKETSDDPLAKKRKRQQRNKDAALRSRERRKMYVKELEMKSKYYEAECRRLGSILQFVMSENQALRFSLHTSSKAFDASMTKQESAVLLLESLLLGSLLWLMGIVVLPSLLLVLALHHRSQLVEEKFLPSLVGVLSRHTRMRTLLVGKRFKASRSRMRLDLSSFSRHLRFSIHIFPSFCLFSFPLLAQMDK